MTQTKLPLTVEQRLDQIENRNLRVEKDKAWETSWARRVTIAGLTYAVVAIYLSVVVHNDRPLINAFVPVVGYMLSTLVVGSVRSRWEARN